MFGPSVDLGFDVRDFQEGAQALAQGENVALAIRAALFQGGCDAPILGALEMPEREILKLPLDLPDAQTARERREHRARLERKSLALRDYDLTGMAHLHEVLGQARENEPGIAHYCEQHFAHGLRLLWPEPLRCRPVARQAKLAQALKLGSGARGLRRYQAGELLDCQTSVIQRGTYEDGVCQILACRQGANDLCGFNTQHERRRRAYACKLNRRGCLRD